MRRQETVHRYDTEADLEEIENSSKNSSGNDDNDNEDDDDDENDSQDSDESEDDDYGGAQNCNQNNHPIDKGQFLTGTGLSTRLGNCSGNESNATPTYGCNALARTTEDNRLLNVHVGDSDESHRSESEHVSQNYDLKKRSIKPRRSKKSQASDDNGLVRLRHIVNSVSVVSPPESDMESDIERNRKCEKEANNICRSQRRSVIAFKQ